jgi:hypothetical protein
MMNDYALENRKRDESEVEKAVERTRLRWENDGRGS